MGGNETGLLLRPEQALFDVTDKSLYSFDDRVSMEKFRESSTVMALNNFFALADTDAAKLIVYLAEKAPHIKKVFDSLKGKTELVVKLSEEARRKLASGEWQWVMAKDGSGLLPTLRDAAKDWAQQIRVEQIIIRPEMLNSLMNLTQKNNLDALMQKVIELTEAVDRIAAGQYNDRIAMFYGARQTYIEAMSMDSPDSRRVALLNAAKSSNDAIATLQQTIRYDLTNLLDLKSGKELDESTRLIAKCFSKLNDSVQVSINAYAALGENRAMLAAVTSYQCFVEQTWLPKVSGGKYDGCNLAEIMFASSERSEHDWRQLPVEIVNTCEAIIETERETRGALVEALERQRFDRVIYGFLDKGDKLNEIQQNQQEQGSADNE